MADSENGTAITSRQSEMTAGLGPVSLMTRSLGMKFFVLGLLVFMLSMPLLAVWGLVKDREANFRRATAEIGSQWGGMQTLAGPMLEVPVTVRRPPIREGDAPSETDYTVVVAPDTLAVDGRTTTETRRRGIHEAVVYQAGLAFRARFSPPGIEALYSSGTPTVDWSRARIIAGISDLKGVETLSIKANGRNIEAIEPALGSSYGDAETGLSAPAGFARGFADGAQTLEIALDLDLKGSQEIRIAPVGDVTAVTLSSSWPHPSFSGTFLPKSREIGADGFSASWSVPKLARQIPHLAQASHRSFPTYAESAFGVRFYQPIDFYKQVERAVKYGVLFVSMAFLVIFVIEILSKGRMHLVHYAMTGMMIVVFYTMLLALAEFVGFTAAYAIAAGATGTVLAGFVSSLFAGRIWTLAAFGGFVGLYGFLYVVLQLAEAALLVGSITGFVILSVLMFATRDTDWSGRASQTNSA